MLTVALLRASLPSYFPDRHKVWDRAEAILATLCAAHGARLTILPGIPQDARETQATLDHAAAEGADFILCLHGGFTMGDVARTIAASPFRAGFWSVPEPIRTGDVQLNNFVSLNMSLSIARGVRDLTARPVQWYHGAPEDHALQRRLSHTLRALTAAKALEGARIGVIGGLAMTFYNMEVSTNALRTRLGIEVAHHDIHELTGRMAAQDAARITAEVTAMTTAAPVHGVSDPQMRLTAACALSLRDMAAGYDALAVSDWPALQADPGMHPGAAFSWIETADNLPIASEGDVLGAVTQIVARSLSGQTGALLDMTEPDFDADRLLVWHGGGGPLHLADTAGATWINHPMIGRADPNGPRFGAIADYIFAPGPATLLRISRNGAALFTMGGTVVAQDPSGFDGCRGWLSAMTIAQDAAHVRDVVASVMGHGLEHHFVLIPGDHQPAALEFAGWTGMTPLRKRPFRDHLDAGDYAPGSES
jgi:L-fucose isomerase-like protein